MSDQSDQKNHGFKRENIIYAADAEDLSESLQIIKEIAPYIGWVKITPFVALGSQKKYICELANNLGLRLFLDMKFHDIPSTVYKSVATSIFIGASMITIHIAGGLKMMEAAVQARNDSRTDNNSPPALIMGVTVLTSLPASKASVLSMAHLAKSGGLDGVICSAYEVQTIHQIVGKNLLTVVPGLRFDIDNLVDSDQQRVATPQCAIDTGANYIVLGRTLHQANGTYHLRKLLDQSNI